MSRLALSALLLTVSATLLACPSEPEPKSPTPAEPAPAPEPSPEDAVDSPDTSPEPTAAPAPLPLVRYFPGDLYGVLERKRVQLSGTYETRSTMMWGGNVPSLTLADGTAVPLRLRRTDLALPEAGAKVVVKGTLSPVLSGANLSITEEAGVDPLAEDTDHIQPAWELEYDGVVKEAEVKDALGDARDLARVSRSRTARFSGTLIPAKVGEVEDAYVLRLERDSPMFPVRFVVEARAQMAAMAGRQVVLTGAASAAEENERTVVLDTSGLSPQLQEAIPFETWGASWVIEMVRIEAALAKTP